MNKLKAIITLLCGLSAACLHAADKPVAYKPFYVGVSGGIGSTTWKGLVPSPKNLNEAISASTPVDVEEGGPVYGVFAGYEFSPYFALEANYRHYQSATVNFVELSFFAIDHDDRINFNTRTESGSLMAKVMLDVPNSILRVYSSFGLALVHRSDEITKQLQKSPTFGLGLNLNVSPRVMVDLGVNYTAGYGESELEPCKSYIPFLLSGGVGLAYRF